MRKLFGLVSQNAGIAMLVFAALSFLFPQLFVWVKGNSQTLLLGFLIFCMTITMDNGALKSVVREPGKIALGGASQYLIMPLSAFLLCIVFHPRLDVEIGLMMVACCPGAAASNLVTFLAEGDVAYSICITMLTTILAPFVTPMLTLLFLGSKVTVLPLDMFKSIVMIVLLPLLLGFLCKRLIHSTRSQQLLQDVIPFLAVIGLGLIVAGPLAIYGGKFSMDHLVGFGLALLLNAMGYVGGWFSGKLFHMDRPHKVALSIEVGMQNAGLAIGLCMKFFGDYPNAALIAAFACAVYAIIGSFAAVAFRKRASAY